MHYDLTDLRLFVNVGATLNLTRAAEKSFLSLPSASLRIKHLEESFQTPLLMRQRNGLQLTQAGEALLKHASIVLQQLEVLHADLRPYAKGIKGRIRLQANTAATNTILAEALSAFLKDNPEVDIELEEQTSREVIAAVAKGTVDLGIVAGTVAPDELDVLRLYSDELVAIVHPLDPIGKRDSLRLADMLDECRFVGKNDSIQDFLDRNAHRMGKRVSLRIQVGSFDAICRMVAAGAGVAIVPRAVARSYTGKEPLRLLPLQESWARREISLVRQHGRLLPEFAQALIRQLIAAAAHQ